MSRSNTGKYLAVAAAGGVGYYLYRAGGNAKTAGQKASDDIAREANTAASHLPGDNRNYTQTGAQLGSKIDHAKHDTKENLEKAKHEIEAYSKARKDELMRGIDKADQKIEEKARGWFGGK